VANNVSWFVTRWRPSAAWLYLLLCILDFAVFPVLWMTIHPEQWTPLTLQGAGVFHMSFGAIIGISAHSRGQEKIALINRE